jgi:hypothetical protein
MEKKGCSFKLDGGEKSASRPVPLTPYERVFRTHSVGGWVGTRARWDAAGIEPRPFSIDNTNVV